MRRSYLLVAVWVLAGCGAGSPFGSAASGATTSNSSTPTAPSRGVLSVGDCTGPPTSANPTTSKSLGMDSITLRIPPGWSDQTNQVTGIAALLRVQAPADYGSDNATFMLMSIPGPRRGSSSHEQATEDAAGRVSLGPQSSVNDCTVAGEKASFYRYQDSAGNDVYRLLVLHSPISRYPFLYAVEISSRGRIDDRAGPDVLAILGSWTWGAPIYDPNS